MSGHIEIAPGTTYCPDTPDNWLHFHRLKRAIQTGSAGGKHKITSPEQFNQLLQKQISRENKSLRSMRSHLPGHEPDKPFFD